MLEQICQNLTKVPDKVYNWNTDINVQKQNFALAENMNSQNNQVMRDVLQTINTEGEKFFSVPFYLTIFLFVTFVLVMTAVYFYHWTKFSMGDKFVLGFLPIYLGVLALFFLPLIVFILI